ncbi:MAG: hypothetical protein JSR65_13495 [Proteobacteria bacterium]|nr:hypothetical protein [Pseudomonadota bacterium]
MNRFARPFLRTPFALLALVSMASFAAPVSLTPVNIAAQVNSDLTTYTGGGNYPQNGGSLAVGAITFNLTAGSNTRTWVVQTSNTAAQTFSIPINRTGVTTAYTLINSANGTCGQVAGEVDFVGASSTYVYTLTEGTNIRDHYNGVYCNTVSGAAGTANFGPDRLDMQQIALPGSFATDTLLRIDFKGNGLGNGGPFLAAMVMDGTPAAAVPAPALGFNLRVMLATLLLALGAGALVRRLRIG